MSKTLCRSVFLSVSLVVSGCVAYGQIDNEILANDIERPGYSIARSILTPTTSETTVLLSFSGGGTRAAALSYGVLQGLRESNIITLEGGSHTLLDDVRAISAVSGGSFTAAYYGLHGNDTFEHFEQEFLRRDLSAAFWRGVFNPLKWFSPRGRTDRTAQYFDDNVFHGAVFDDLKKPGRPLIIINATDLGSGIRFSFLQEYFDLLCSDLSNFKIAKAVTASSAVPIMFHPIVLKRYPNCDLINDKGLATQLPESNPSANTDAELDLVTNKMMQFEALPDEPTFVHLVDGGITDNLGLRTLYEIIALSGGATQFLDNYNQKPPRRLVVISVNAAIEEPNTLNTTNRRPAIDQTALAMSSIQLERYNAATINLINDSLNEWAKELSTPNHPVESYFIQIDLENVNDANLRRDLNLISTSYSLNDKQVDSLIATGNNLLKDNDQYQLLMRAMQE